LIRRGPQKKNAPPCVMDRGHHRKTSSADRARRKVRKAQLKKDWKGEWKNSFPCRGALKRKKLARRSKAQNITLLDGIRQASRRQRLAPPSSGKYERENWYIGKRKNCMRSGLRKRSDMSRKKARST